MNSTRKLWAGLAVLLIASFAVLLWVGSEVHRQAPPMPEAVVSQDGQILYTRQDIETGRQVWQSIGGQQLGSIWGHGGYVAPDWGADWLHREAEAILDIWAAREHGAASHKDLDAPTLAAYATRVQALMRPNTYDAATGAIQVDADRAQAMRQVAAHYQQLFGSDPAMRGLREAYAMREGTVPDPEHRRQLTGFYWWAAWSSVTLRPNEGISYTANWPYDELVGNTAPPSTFLWTVFSVLFLIAGIALLGWHYAVNHGDEMVPVLPKSDPLAAIEVTPSMRATAKYFWVVIALFLTQILLGAITAHYQVEGQEAYGFALADVLPYALTRTWHTQLAVLWIATAWLGMGLYIGPAISGHEPRFQRLGVNVLWACLLVIVVGSFVGQWLAVMQKLGLEHNFWFGHQGWEYVDMGRFWQWFLFIGLGLWLLLVGRALWPSIRGGGESRSIVTLLFLSTVAIGLFYAAGLMWGEHTHLSMVEYWRWWVVHLWVEGFFEVFAVAVIAFLFTRLGLLQVRSATVAVLFATIVFMAGGVLGTLHHLYFTGTPTAVIALGASISALEVVPLAYVGFEAYQSYRLGKATPWMAKYKWPITFFIAVAFWNLVGAGLFGFLINPPLPLYYMQGLNLTPTHGHTALFGVYGMLGIGLMLFCLRGLKPDVKWSDKLLKTSFWSLNIGLAGMAAFTLLPLGILQLNAALKHGYWYARSAEFMQQPIVDLLVWMRVPADTLFSVGALALAWFVLRLWVAPKRETPVSATAAAAATAIAPNR
ncbi:nitric oxide reductase large subunit [Pseudoxanthomonas broegbernensis]|uniref:Nitric oxide reductase large subunit n=1 Tax=Pseudoxanthomonas broegbernensis TaxID=83619 RepID=A0A7V8GNH8_9GAMM|nr:nitric-oxide reductase large subunit [Pseudoxanthomonas broegbernensis]KAF1687168.1 nitric oxide reductase large subunit [Pseudoxanthomonas broegbernensis]MBB6065852.1 nitric oxide reductase subunit B [Pseudoxanthomonas broegbernensis]